MKCKYEYRNTYVNRAMYWFGEASLKILMWDISAWQGAVKAKRSRHVRDVGTPNRHSVTASSLLVKTLKKKHQMSQGDNMRVLLLFV